MSFKKVANIVLIPIKILLVLLIVFVAYSYFDKVFEVKGVERAEYFHRLPENSMDVVVLGSSHAQYSFAPSIFYDETGLYSIVMGSACQPLEVSYQMLKETLKTQSPKFVILEAYTAMPLREICEADVCYVHAQYMMTGKEKYRTIDFLPKEKADSYRNEFINNHNNWRDVENINDLKVDLRKNKEYYVDGNMGYVIQYPQLPITNCWYAKSYEDVVDVELDELDLESLNNIYDLCLENGIQLILYKTPIDNIDVENYSYLMKVWQWCEEKNIPYLDMIALQSKIDFKMVSHSDSYHCNIVGANTITSEIGRFINETYVDKELDTGHTEFNIINEAYRNDLLDKALDVYQYDRNVYRALERVKSSDLTMAIRYLPGTIMQDQLKETLIEFGVNENFDYGKPYFAFINNNNNIILESNDLPIEMATENNKMIIGLDGINLNGEELGTEGQLNIVFCKNNLGRCVLKNINIDGYPWEYGYDYFMKKEN